MVRTGRWRVLLAATLVGVVLRTAPAGAAIPPGAPTDPTTTTAPGGAGSSSTSSSTTSTTLAPSTTTTVAPATLPGPVVTGPIATTVGDKGHPLAATLEDLKGSGYVERELFVAGTGTVHGQSGSWGSDGRWAVKDVTQAPYRTRVLVRQPADPARFDGTVVVSWLNVNGAFETAPEWTQIGTELMREGAAFVGVSAQMLGVDGPLGARRWDPARYGALDVSADSLSYDVFTQVAQAIRAPKGVDLLGGLSTPRRMIATGQSQSAQRLVTYLNAFQPTTHAFDGFFLVSRFRGAAPLGRTLLPAEGVLSPSGPDAAHPFLPDPLAALVSGPPQALIRSDTTVPVFVVDTETEAVQDAAVHQPDSSRLRTWEIAGASDVDGTITAAVVTQLRRDFPSIPTGQLTACAQPNVFPTRYALRAAMRSLATWVAGGAAPASAPSLRLTRSGAIVRDSDGNALGGLRLPAVDVPTARYTGESTAGDYCALTGTTAPFSPSSLAQRYPTTQVYADAVAATADAAVKAGHLLAEDAAQIVSDARGGATQAVIADHAAAAAAAGTAGSAAAGGSTGSGTAAARPSVGTGPGKTITAASSMKATTADSGWLATTGRDLITPLLGGLLLILNGRVVLTIAQQRRRRAGL